MAYPTDYAGWIELVKDFLDIDDLSDDRIQTFLSLGQTRLNRELNSQWMEAEAPLTVATFGVAIPIMTSIPDFNRILLVTPNTGSEPLDVVAYNEYKKLVALNSAGAAPPINYAIQNQLLYVYPYPGVGDIFNISYYMMVPELSLAISTNIFTDHHPDALLYASCLEGARFIVEDERIPIWNNAYNLALDTSNNVAKNAKMGSTPLKRQINLYRQNVRMS